MNQVIYIAILIVLTLILLTDWNRSMKEALRKGKFLRFSLTLALFITIIIALGYLSYLEGLESCYDRVLILNKPTGIG